MRTPHQPPGHNKYYLPVFGLLAFLVFSSPSLATSRYPASIEPIATETNQQQLHETTDLGQEIWSNLTSEFTWHYERGKYLQALDAAQRAHTLAERLFGAEDINTADSLLKLGIIHQTLSHLTAAKDYFEQSLHVLENGLSPDAPNIAVTLTNLGNIYFELGNYAASEAAHSKALLLRRNAYGPGSAKAAQSLYNLGVLYEHQQDHANAIRHYQNATNLWSTTLGKNHPYIGNTLQNLTFIYISQQRYAEASNTQRRIIAFKKSMLGESHQDVAKGLINLGALYIEQNQYKAASEAYSEALSIAEQNLGSDDPQLALLLYSLGNTYHVQARMSDDSSNQLLGQALPFYERALQAMDNNSATDAHPALQIILSELALLYKELGESNKAIATETRLARPGKP